MAEVTGTRHAALAGARDTIPLMIGTLPFGVIYGTSAVAAGLSPLAALAMSLIVFAGSAQFIAVSLISGGAALPVIWLTTFVVNLRHLLMSAALAPFLRAWSKTRLALFAYQMTDETFALHANRFAKGETGPTETYGINVIAQSAWVGGTVLGLAASTLITDIRPIGLDYALPAMFIALLLGQLKSRQHLLVAVAAGLMSTALMFAGLGESHVLAATIIAATIGLGAHAWTSRRSS